LYGRRIDFEPGIAVISSDGDHRALGRICGEIDLATLG
jgi:hypothetical protein